MKLLTISNLFPRPDQPCRGVFNLELFTALARCDGCVVDNVCLVPEWRAWRLGRRWARAGKDIFPTIYAPVFYLPVIGRGISHVTYRWSLGEVEAKARDCDEVLSTWLYPDGVVAARIAKKAGKPHWILVQGSDVFHLRHPGRRKAILDACGKAAGILCVWEGLKKQLVESGVDAGKIHTIANGVNADLFKFRTKSEARRLLEGGDHARKARPDGQEIVLFAGNLVEVKGADRLMEIWLKLLQMRERDIHLAIIGDGPMRKSMQSGLASLSSRATVSFLGTMPHEEVACWMNLADCLCLPSRSEGMPNVVLEALVSGLPVVSTDVGACGELLKDVPQCRIVEDVEVTTGLAFAVGDVLRHEIDRESFAARNRAILPDWNEQAGKMLQLMGGANCSKAEIGH